MPAPSPPGLSHGKRGPNRIRYDGFSGCLSVGHGRAEKPTAVANICPSPAARATVTSTREKIGLGVAVTRAVAVNSMPDCCACCVKALPACACCGRRRISANVLCATHRASVRSRKMPWSLVATSAAREAAIRPVARIAVATSTSIRLNPDLNLVLRIARSGAPMSEPRTLVGWIASAHSDVELPIGLVSLRFGGHSSAHPTREGGTECRTLLQVPFNGLARKSRDSTTRYPRLRLLRLLCRPRRSCKHQCHHAVLDWRTGTGFPTDHWVNAECSHHCASCWEAAQ